MIKIVSAISAPVGSTIALVNLCNQFNSRGYNCIFYGPDNWHIAKCKSAKIYDFYPEYGDIIIINNIKLSSASELYHLKAKFAPNKNANWLHLLKNKFLLNFESTGKPDGIKLIFTCPSDESFQIRRMKYRLFDKIHYCSDTQKGYQSVEYPNFVCPSFSSDLTESVQKPDKVAGVIGSIKKENKIELSIERALQDGMKTVIIYGYLIDPVYYYSTIEPLTKQYPGRIEFAGFVDDKQKLYDSVSDVYCAVSKPWSLVKRECDLTNTRFHKPDSKEDETMTNDQIFGVWKKELVL